MPDVPCIPRKPKRFWYETLFIAVVLKTLLGTSIHFRCLSQALKILYPEMGEGVPTHTTLINWVHKIGLYRLSQLREEKKRFKDWIILLDHSIQIGKEKVLVIMGVRESQLRFDRPLQFRDLTPLLEISQEDWDGNRVASIIEKLKKEVGGILYAVADYGSDIKKGLEKAGIRHVYDLTHQIALVLKRLYKKDKDFQSFTGKMRDSRIQNQQTKLSHLIPPHQRSKSWFVGKISDWGTQMIRYLEKDNADGLKKFGWVLDYKTFIEELSEINITLGKIQKIVKTYGLNEKTEGECRGLLEELKTEKGKYIAKEMIEYFSKNRFKKKTILCSSDILESAFGKYMSVRIQWRG